MAVVLDALEAGAEQDARLLGLVVEKARRARHGREQVGPRRPGGGDPGLVRAGAHEAAPLRLLGPAPVRLRQDGPGSTGSSPRPRASRSSTGPVSTRASTSCSRPSRRPPRPPGARPPVKLYYVAQVSTAPPTFVLHCSGRRPSPTPTGASWRTGSGRGSGSGSAALRVPRAQAPRPATASGAPARSRLTPPPAPPRLSRLFAGIPQRIHVEERRGDHPQGHEGARRLPDHRRPGRGWGFRPPEADRRRRRRAVVLLALALGAMSWIIRAARRRERRSSACSTTPTPRFLERAAARRLGSALPDRRPSRRPSSRRPPRCSGLRLDRGARTAALAGGAGPVPARPPTTRRWRPSSPTSPPPSPGTRSCSSPPKGWPGRRRPRATSPARWPPSTGCRPGTRPTPTAPRSSGRGCSRARGRWTRPGRSSEAFPQDFKDSQAKAEAEQQLARLGGAK